jgi:hypothetical protein
MDTYTMPKSPTTRLGIPRYEDSETASFSAQVNAISEAIDAKAELRLVNRPLEVSAVAVAQDRIIFKGTGGGSGYTATLPVPAAEARIAVLNETTAAKECKVKVNTGQIYGDFVTGATEITLSVGQHVELVSDGTNWFIVAGESKREQTYSAITHVGTTATTPSVTRPAMVTMQVPFGEASTKETFTFYVPPGQAFQQHGVNGGSTITISVGGVTIVEVKTASPIVNGAEASWILQ